MKSCCAFLFGFFFCLSLHGQSSDTVFIRHKHNSRLVALEREPAAGFSAQMFALPALLFGYGLMAQNNDGLTDLNEGIHRVIWTDNPHGTTHIDNYLQWSPAVAAYALNFAGIKGKHDLPDRSMIYAMALVIQSSSVYVVKRIAKETRPNDAGTASFPSGHTSNAFAGAEFLRREYKDISLWYAVGGYLAAAATGYLRMYNDKHWFGDIVAGAGT